jgi:hypothetical protein
MLTNVPSGINRMARNVVMNHPNTFSCEVYRKAVTRPAETSVGGLPTMGGLGVLDSMDEDQFEYAFMGYGYALPADGGFAPAPMVRRSDANIGAGDEFRFLIEPEEPDEFDVREHDVLYLLLGVGKDAPKLAYEIVAIETTSNIPPYTTRYIANRRNDLDLLTPEDSPR